jgi:curli production assembly/transport component CsgG
MTMAAAKTGMDTRTGSVDWARTLRGLVATMFAVTAAGCANTPVPTVQPAALTPPTRAYPDLLDLPRPHGRIAAAVYGFRDQTGQYRPAPDSSFSTAVTQGASAFLIKALNDSGWFVTMEREGLQNLLTERRIVRAIEGPQDAGNAVKLPALRAASILIEGGVIAYESNVRTGGLGAAYLGVSASAEYRSDQVTVHLRAVDVRSGDILASAMTTKTVLSYKAQTGLFRFVSFKSLAEFETGLTRAEPIQVCVNEAIESAVIHLIARGLQQRLWAAADPNALEHPVIRAYLDEQRVPPSSPIRPADSG